MRRSASPNSTPSAGSGAFFPQVTLAVKFELHALLGQFDEGPIVFQNRLFLLHQAGAISRHGVNGNVRTLADCACCAACQSPTCRCVGNAQRAQSARAASAPQRYWGRVATRVVDAQRAYLSVANSRIQSEGRRLTETVALFVALGDGWGNREEAKPSNYKKRWPNAGVESATDA